MNTPVRIVLFSEVNSKLGAPFLKPLAAHPLTRLAGLVTSPPGRLCSYFVGEPDPVDLAVHAAGLGVPVLRPEKVNAPETRTWLQRLRPDYFLVCNYQQIFKERLLAVPSVTCINFHPSPLPRYAGLAPFYWMVRHGERDGAVSVIEMTAGIDEGPILMRRSLPLTGRETTSSLRAAQERLNIDTLRDLVPQLAARSLDRTPQDPAQRTYFGRPTDADLRIDPTRTAQTVDRVVRAGYRRPGAHLDMADGRRITVLSVEHAGTHGLATPGSVRPSATGVLLATEDAWLRITSIDQDGHEVPADHQHLRDLSAGLAPPRETGTAAPRVPRLDAS
ncbi:methionyl-tRNA formyltransferase [Streptomyces fagopyri]|uniref:methionyl-tRNA formyltransferase n=1 Tax=Streptomyces fagopyri TaxID=2662397 RepID=UPI00371068B8